ncbi:PIG-L family deacetylase [Micromonospora echinofusca]|uniref:PIG-L family deacetylase n=1 Tax=Micromonospora echinofusca TaxID=47858 RepID=UPI0033CA117E
MTFPASAPARTDAVRALAVFAHPDDADPGCAGTITTWVDEATDVAYPLATQGDRTVTTRRPARRAAAPIPDCWPRAVARSPRRSRPMVASIRAVRSPSAGLEL